ncbi:hypothetical protein TNCV_3378951 [Trichonephila clavipes]|nr:hypothetical protein TNCV_3378951 [Trichonephila clavipes]
MCDVLNYMGSTNSVGSASNWSSKAFESEAVFIGGGHGRPRATQTCSIRYVHLPKEIPTPCMDAHTYALIRMDLFHGYVMDENEFFKFFSNENTPTIVFKSKAELIRNEATLH